MCLTYLRPRTRGLTLAAVVVALDAASKAWALSAAQLGELPIPLHPNFATLTLAFNRGMSFSLLNDAAYGGYLLGALAIAASIWFTHWLGESRNWLHQLGLGAIIGGAVGNLIDRIQHGAVVDFFMPVWNGQPYFPVFNLADACISAGVVLLLADWFISGRKKA